jgi:NAD(P)-dependent dehydrogenase (short-subunit alcohol dehydrogenase family)
MVDVQFIGAIWAMKHLCNAMVTSGGGSMINVSSLTAHNPSPGHAAYAGSKAGVEYITQIAAVEYGASNVRVNTISAHLIETPMTAGLFQMPLKMEALRQQTPLGRMGHVSDIANCALYLASEESGYVSGETIKVDGAASSQKLPSALEYELLEKARPDLV